MHRFLLPAPPSTGLRTTGLRTTGLRTTLAAAAALLLLPGCSVTQSNESSGDSADGAATGSSTGTSARGGHVRVAAADDACDLSTTRVPAGTVVFRVENTGDQVTEFYLLTAGGRRVVGEVEDIGPGLTRDLVAQVAPGNYVTACKPGMRGEGVRAGFTVTGSHTDGSIPGVDRATADAAAARYARYVRKQTDELLDRSRAFLGAWTAGRDAEARRLYPLARAPWERIETVAESFGDLDPRTDAREADLAPGQRWTGWHRIEKDLWPPAGYQALSPAQRREYAAALLADLRTLQRRVQDLDVTVSQIGNGAAGLLEEVATGKVTGEEEVWSHTDLADFQANLDGAQLAYETLKPLLVVKDAALSRTIGRRFADLQDLLDRYRRGAGFVSYDTVGPQQRRQLSDAVNALAEPLAQMTAAITL
ncbi:MAG TPA: iron uptake system protein EfeO [Marmoricola sp.]|nr:iron uptake system protein EfeO [Marmoricola sp.]